MNEGGGTIRALAAQVATFHITDRAMVRAQTLFAVRLAAGEPEPAEVESYVSAVRTYFTGFDRDAHAQLRSVDRQLDALYQRQYNLAAERGVAIRRIEVVQGVLAMLTELTAS